MKLSKCVCGCAGWERGVEEVAIWLRVRFKLIEQLTDSRSDAKVGG